MPFLPRSLFLLVLLATSARAQRVVLELRPRFGDTLHMRLDQTTEVSGTRKGVSTKPVVTTLSMFSRAIVESSAPASALILAITDSVNVSTTDERAAPAAQETQRQLAGRHMRLRLSPDGTVSVADDETNVPRRVNEIVALMPASFPRGSVTIGDTWLREMPIPPTSPPGVPLVVRAAFRLDSVSPTADIAYLSMRGTVEDATSTARTSSSVTGSVNGSMVVDRRRGWLSESRFAIRMRTRVAGGTKESPIQLRMNVTQQMRVLDGR